MTSSTWDVVLQHVARRLSDVAETTIDSSELVLSPKPDLGDVAFGCFKLAKMRGKNPAEVASELAEKLGGTDVTIERANAAGPYVNIRLSVPALVPRLIAGVRTQGEAFGQSSLQTPETLLFEYANPNTHKEIHVGHLRNFILGASLVRILRRAGTSVIPVSYINDIGTHVAKCLWYLVTSKGFVVQQFSDVDLSKLISAVPETDRTAKYLGQIYTDATRALEEDPTAQVNVSYVHTQLEAHALAWESLWRETKRWCMDEMITIFDELGVRIERQYFDSECVDRAHALLKDLEANGVANVSQGALVIDMEEQKLGMMLLRKSDGSLLYAAKDIALAELKAHEYPSFTRSVVLVDERQSLAFRQLAEALKRMNYSQPYAYLGYELVTLPEGAMSSRKGNIVTFQTFRDMVVEAARTATLERHADWNEGQTTYTAWCLAMAGIKYATLKQDPEKLIVFDIQKALSFDGDTGPYILYAATRLAGIVKKTGWTDGLREDLDFSGVGLEPERRLVLRVAQFVEVVRRAARETKPSILAQWCFGMAQDVNAFYRDVPVNDAPSGLKEARLQIVQLSHHALVHGLDLLGIAVPEEM